MGGMFELAGGANRGIITAKKPDNFKSRLLIGLQRAQCIYLIALETFCSLRDQMSFFDLTDK